MIDAEVSITTSRGRQSRELGAYLSDPAEEQAHRDEYEWIKSLRHLDVEGQSFRDCFVVRGDSLWWFSELYLHKTQAILDIHRTIAALDALIEDERPSQLTVMRGSVAVRHVAGQVARARGIDVRASVRPSAWWRRLAALDIRARRLALSARVSPDRFRSAPAVASPAIAAFVHRAFWRAGGEAGSAESYIGPVLHELERQLGAGQVRYIGVGPTTNFRQRRRLAAQSPSSPVVIPIERYASGHQLSASRLVWRDRYTHFRRLLRSASFRNAARIKGVDCWPVIREQLAGIVWLQWPWSVRAMDEAAASLESLRPKGIVTYAEAGGWGRALILEARRRQIPSAGLQHGFIYRHWLNYLHEPDEMLGNATAGFPHPTRTLLFDDFAAHHLRVNGRFPPDALCVTGSPRLDALRERVATLTRSAVDEARRSADLRPNETFVLVTTKEREARPYLTALVSAAAALPRTILVIKPHPAETSEAYRPFSEGQPHVRVLASDAPLAPLLAAARAVVTVNSTVAVDAGLLGIPALSVGLPNNLSPFVDAGAMAGTSGTAELPERLRQILYDDGFRQQLDRDRRGFLARFAMAADGRAAERSAEAVLALAAARRRS